MDEPSNTSYGGPSSGLSENTPSKEDATQNQPPNTNSQPVVSSTTTSIPQPPEVPSDTLGSLNPVQLTAQAKIPPLMSIQTNVATLTSQPTPSPNTPPVNNPTPAPPKETPLQSALSTEGASVTSVPEASTTQIPPVVQAPPAAVTNSTMVFGKPRVSQGKVLDGTSSYSTGDTDSDEGVIQKKVPILRLKKKLMGQDDADATFERQEISKNDSYCWVCHDGGDVLCCDKCPRVFHIQCSGLPKEPEDDEEWFCPVCKNIARKTKRSRPSNLKELLLLAVSRMMFPGTEIFQSPVPADIMVHYREYIFHPLDLGTIRKKVAEGVYQSTREFTHDTEWILHNCIIYNGAKHALTKIAKGIIKVCKEDMREIELCPGCYKLTVKQPKDWFCVPCNPPHPVVLAKVRGYPLWPAKLISETSDKCDVRFFGQHDRSLVPKSSISELNGLPPKPSTKTQHWNIAMFELKKYGENIEEMRAQMSGGKLPGKTIRFPKQRDPKTPNTDHSNQHKDLANSISNHVASSPAVVEVSPGSVHGNSSQTSDRGHSIISEPSSPDSPPGLQIDLEDSSQGGRQFQSPGKGLGILSAIERNSQVSGSLDFSGDTGPQTVTNSTVLSPTSSLSKIKRGIKGRKAGDTLSQLVSSLAERKRMGVVTPGSSAPVVVTSSGVATPVESLEPEQGAREDTEDPVGSTPTVVDVNTFSSVYLDRNKTAIYEVDLNGKRDRKRKKPNSESTPPQAKKPARTKTSPTKSVTTNDTLTDSPQIHVAASELVKLSHAVMGDRVPSSVSPQPPPMIVPGSNGQTHITTTPLSGSSIIVGPKTTPVKANRSSNPAKKKSKPKSSKGSKPSLAGKAVTTSAPSVVPSPSVMSREQNSLIITSSVTHPTTSTFTTASEDVRGEEAAPGVGGVPMEEDFQEGNGLLADTIRKVNRSFHARLNQMAGGGSEDMGYQYFMEKLMSSVKTVLIEMLSTFDAKSRLSAKQLKEQLHTCWPVPNSRVALDQLRKELRDEMKQSLEVVRASAALELEQVVNEVKRQVEKEKEIAINETKKKKWCSYCMNEAQYNCCWNANYCNEVCQQAHWPEHMKDCSQVQQQVPKTPGLPPSEVPLSTPVSKAPTPHVPNPTPSLGSSGGTGSMSVPESVQTQQQGYMFVNSSAAAMAAAAVQAAHVQRQGQSVMGGVPGSVSNIPHHTVPSAQSGPSSVSSGSHPQQQKLSQDSSRGHTSSPMIEGMVQQHALEHATPPENPSSRMEHLSTENILMTTAAASPPNHIRSLFLNQQAQQRMNAKSPAMNLMGSHQGPGTPGSALHHGLSSTPIGIAENVSMSSGAHQAQHQGSEHSHSSSSGGVLLHAQSPISPAISHAESQPTAVHNYSWPYQQQFIMGNESFHPAALPAAILPAAMQVNTSSSQNQPFFKATY